MKSGSLMRGVSMNFVAFPSGFFYFFVYQGFKWRFSDLSKLTHPSLCHLLAASLAETVSIIIRNPFEVVKQQIQVGLDSKPRLAFAHIYKHRGISGFYAGFWSYVMRETPASAITMATYELMRSFTMRSGKRAKDIGFIENARNGAIAGGVGRFHSISFFSDESY